MGDNYTGALLEDIDHKIDLILEAQAALTGVPQKINEIDARLIRVEGDVKVIKKVVTEHSRELRDHYKRITTLEQT